MPLQLSDLLPNANQSLDGSGFLFGAGTSFEAGYPLMPTLTISVVDALSTTERGTLDEVLAHEHLAYDEASGFPNIETLADVVMAHAINSHQARFMQLEERMRHLVRDSILDVAHPNLEHHCKFFESLKKRAFGFPCTVWIFTTNYDLLFELAGAQTGVLVETGFSGTVERFFHPDQFRSQHGSINGGRFAASNHLTVKLVKLHGSVSWIDRGGAPFEIHPSAIERAANRLMILPRRKKVVDTLMRPFDTLFAVVSRMLGTQCKYLVSAGFSYGDDHINENLLLPALKTNKCRVFALSKEEPSGLSNFRSLPAFGGGFESHLIKKGKQESGSTDLWQFSRFVSLF